MNQKFSTYLRHIGLLNETASTSMMNSDDKSSNKSFNDSTFDLLMKYFNNLDEEQKKFMSHHIPSNYIINSENIQRDKLRSIFVQLNLRKRFILLKYFFNWKLLSYLNKNNNEKIELKNNDKNGNQLKLINIDNNEDVDIKELNSNNVDEQNSNNNHSNKNFKHLSNNKNSSSNNPDNDNNYKYINVYKNKNDSDKKSYNLGENIIKPNNKFKINNSASHRKMNQINSKENNINIKSHLMTSLEEK